MALIDDLEPPSLPNNLEVKGKTKQAKDQKKTKNQFHKKIEIILAETSKTATITGGLIKTSANFLVTAKNTILTLKFLPHYIVVILALVISGVNFSQKIAAHAYYKDIINVTPDSKYAISKEADIFTSLIADDAGATERSILADTSGSGFATATTGVTTEITDREEPLPDNSSNTVYYTIRNGDTLTGIGWKFDVKVATLKYLNDIDNENLVKPGINIKVPEKGYQVSASLIAKKEQDKKAKLAAATRNTVTRNSSSSRVSVKKSAGSKINGYPYGYCTYYVASKRHVPSSWGDAKAWLNSAQRAGYATGSQPAVGAIIVTRESWWGHVAYVERVDGNSVTISEMNARGWGVTSSRTISTNDGIVRGFIY